MAYSIVLRSAVFKELKPMIDMQSHGFSYNLAFAIARAITLPVARAIAARIHLITYT